MTLLDFNEVMYLKDDQKLNIVLVDVDMQKSRPLIPMPELYDDLVPFLECEVLQVGFEDNIVTVSIEYHNSI